MDEKKNIFLRLQEWLEAFAQERNAMRLLFVISFIEASLFPISVDVPLIALGVAAPQKGLRLGLVATIGSFLGGYLGYAVGFLLFDAVGKPLLDLYGLSHSFDHLLSMYHQHGIGALILSGFTPLPYILFTYAAGFNRTLDVGMLTIGALAGRTLRFYPIGVLLYYAGPQAKIYLEKYFRVATVSFIILIIAGLIFFKWLL